MDRGTKATKSTKAVEVPDSIAHLAPKPSTASRALDFSNIDVRAEAKEASQDILWLESCAKITLG